LKVFLKQDSSLPLVTIKLYGIGGLLMEDPQNPGLSAFTASLLTAGTKTRSKLDIAKAIENVGGALGSSSDNSTYHVVVKVLKEDLDLALDLLADVIQNPVFPDEEIEKKRQETLLALQRIDESWQAEVVRMLKKNYFTDSPYRNDRIGTADSVTGFTREKIVAFHKRMVNPHHSVVAVYGDVHPDQVLAALEKKFQGWEGKASGVPDLRVETRPLKADRTTEKKNEKSSSALLVATNGLSITDSDRPVLDVLDAILSGAGNPAGRLFDALRGGKEDLVYAVGAFPFYGIKAGFFGVITQTTLANLEKVQAILVENLRRLREEPVSADELETAKNMIATAHRMGLESLDAQAQSAVVNEVLGLGWDYDQKYVQLIQAVKREDVQRVAKELFSHSLIVRTIPEKPVEILAPPPPASDIQAR
ncbi:MAG: insulinase family protein, partial [Syntrophobacteraceae bacterium]|nr:insulinase family protein [Syntrophobacteraceae bacterium]